MMNKGRLSLGLILLLSAGPVSAGELILDELLARTAVQPPASIPFQEQRHSALLKEPLLLSGTLDYLAPGVLRKQVDSPWTETLTVDNESVELVRGDETQRLSLKSNRMMRVMLKGIEALLAGDSSQLEAEFQTQLQGSSDNWTLRLQPRQKRVSRQLQFIEVHGIEDSVASIRLQFDEQEWQLMEMDHGPAEILQ